MYWALNTAGLRSLKLTNCGSSLEFLELAARTSDSLQLKTFEFAMDIGWNEDIPEDATGSILLFLNSFTGLEDLALMLRSDTDWEKLSEAFSKHMSSLRRLVLHARLSCGTRGSEDYDIDWSAGLQEFYSNSSLGFIGCCNFHDIVRIFTLFCPE